MPLSSIEKVKRNATLLFDSKTIQSALDSLANKLTQDYSDKRPIFLVVMNGGLILAGQLLTRLNFVSQLDYCHTTRYRGKTQGGQIEWLAEPHLNFKGRHLIIVDDILDEGHTLQAVIENCQQRGAASVKTLVLVEKLHQRKAKKNLRADYSELQCPDQYIFGFGMDYDHYWRNSDQIYILSQQE